MNILTNYPLLVLCVMGSYAVFFVFGWLLRGEKDKSEQEKIVQQWTKYFAEK